MKKIVFLIACIVTVYLVSMSFLSFQMREKCRSISLGDQISIAGKALGSPEGILPEEHQILYLYDPSELYSLWFKNGVFITTDKDGLITKINCD